MKKYLKAALVGIIFLFALINGSGWGMVYKTEYLMYMIMALISIMLVLRSIRVGAQIGKKKIAPVLLLGTYAFVISSLNGRYDHAMGLMMPFTMTVFFAHISINNTEAKYIGLVTLGASLGLLILYTQTNIFSGWNDNTVAMLAFFGYACFMGVRAYTSKRKGIVILFSLLFLFLMLQTDSRTSSICAVLLAVAAIFQSFTERICISKRWQFALVHFALIVAIIISLIGITPLKSSLDIWSYQYLKKPFFNGRDELARRGFAELVNSVFLGVGYFLRINWHNWAITILTSYGIIGYFSWVTIIKQIIDTGSKYTKDGIVLGLLASVLMVFVQQATELGLIGASNSNPIPYMMFGMILGRIKYLRKIQKVKR